MDLSNFRPRKSLGQNFLINPRVVQKIIDTAQLTGDELVVEVGPGFGILTEALLPNVRKIIAIEKDKQLFTSLRSRFHGDTKLQLAHADALNVPPPPEPYFLIANIPYSITSPLLDHFIRENPQNLPQRAVLLVQKEVAQKICAKPPRMNVLALHVQAFGNPRIIASVSRHNFRPIPKVDSAILRIDFPSAVTLSLSKDDMEKYFSLIHQGFSHKRKMLRAVFPKEILQKAGIEETRRAETLTIQEWRNLYSLT